MIRLVAIIVLLTPAVAAAQFISQRGFAEARGTVFAQDAINDPVTTIGDLLVREEVFVKPAGWFQLAAGADLRANTHDQVEDSWHIDLTDRRRLRPAVSVRRLSGTLRRGPLTIDAGKQFIRWGKTDIIAPTDRFAPRDFMNVIDTELLAVRGLRAVLEIGSNTVDLVWVPFFTPSRIPLVNQRWAVVPPDARAIRIDEGGALLPEGSQTGVRIGHLGSRFESSLSFFNGFNHLPNIEPFASLRSGGFSIVRRYPQLRSYGADVAIPTPWFTLKGETAYFTSETPRTDEYVLYVVELERQTGEWVFVGGYAGEAVTKRRAVLTFAPDRGLTRSAVGRASYTIDPNRSAAIEGAIRQTANGAYMRAEYSQARGQHWRATFSAAVIRGREGDFLGQYRRNSHLSAAVRYSF